MLVSRKVKEFLFVFLLTENVSIYETLCSKLESVQYNAALGITGAICGASQTKLYVELGLEFLKARR